MIQNGMYYITEEYKELVRSVGGEWNDSKKRPVVCLIPSTENPQIYWAIPVGKVNHRDDDAMKRIYRYMEFNDIRGCYYHVGRTTNKSIFFISDSVPITDKYILEEHVGINSKHFIVKNPKLITELNIKLKRILAWENARPNYFRQHISAIRDCLLDELTNIEPEQSTESDIEQTTPESTKHSTEEPIHTVEENVEVTAVEEETTIEQTTDPEPVPTPQQEVAATTDQPVSD